MSRKLLVLTALTISLVALASGAAIAAVSAGNTGWNWANPLPQGNQLTKVTAIGNRVYAGGAGGTLLRSDDAGATWTSVRTGLLDDIQVVREITPDSVIFAGKCALRRTDDGGGTVRRLPWGPSDDSCAAQIASVSFPTSTTGYLLLSNGDVYMTTDGGDTWSKRTSAGAPDPVRDIAFTTASDGVLSAGSRIFHTTDGGQSWTPVQTATNGALFTFDFVDAMNGFAVGTKTDMYATTDGGATWNAVPSDGSTNADDLRGLTCADVNTCIASDASGAQLLRTQNGGTTWVALKPSNSPIFSAAYTSATSAVAVGAGGTTIRTSDAGANWTSVNAAAPGQFNTLRVDSPTNAEVIGGGSVARSIDGGNTWQPFTPLTSGSVRDVTFPTAARGYLVDSTGALTRTDNGGTTWKFLDYGGGAAPTALYAPNADTLLLIGSKGVRKSTDGGNSFSQTGNSKFRKLALSKFSPAGAALFAYNGKSIVVTKNLGKKWASFKKPKGVKTIRSLDMLSAKNGYLLDGKYEVWSTRTGGKKWSRIETTGTNYVAGMAFGDLTHGYLTDNTGRVLATADGGKTWSRQYPFYDAGGSSTMLIAATGSKSAIIAVAGSGSIFSTSTGGAIGNASTLTIKPSAKSVKKGTTVKVSGKLTPASGSERVTVLARVAGAKGGTRWIAQERTVSAGGTFTTSWKVSKATEFVARWSGDAAHDGDAANAVVVKIRKRR